MDNFKLIYRYDKERDEIVIVDIGTPNVLNKHYWDNSKYYGLDGEGEARAYVEHEILGDRLRECCKALLLHKDKDIKYIMGSGIDVLKLKTSMCLFNKVSPNDVFEEVLDVFF